MSEKIEGQTYQEKAKARLSADASDAIIKKNAKKAVSSVKGQINALEYLLTDQEDAVETAKEHLEETVYQTSAIQDGKRYVEKIAQANTELSQAEAAVELTKASLKFYRELQTRL